MSNLRPYYERALERVKRDINDLLGSPEPQHKALIEAFKTAEMCTTALATIPVDTGDDPFAKLSPAAQQQIAEIIAKDLQ